MITVGATSDAYPYSYIDSHGHLTGFAVELFDAVAQEMNMSIRREVAPGFEINRRFAAGELDVDQFFGFLASRTAYAQFSVPYLVLESAICARRGDHRFSSLEDLRRIHAIVAVVGPGGNEFALRHGLNANQIHMVTNEEAIREVADGRSDAALVSDLTGLAQIDRLGIGNVVSIIHENNRYPVNVSFAVRRGDEQLLDEINEGLAILNQSGEFEIIYRRWFSRYEPHTFSRLEVLSYGAAALGLALIVALWALVRQSQLRRRIAQSNELLRAFHQNLPHSVGVAEYKGSGWSIVSLNPEGVRMLGLAEPPALPCPLSQLGLPTEVAQDWEKLFAQCAAASAPFKIERRSRDDRRDLVATLVPLGKEGLPPRCCFLVEDVTDRKQKDTEIAQGRRLRALGELVGGIAHEFNNLLTPILMKSEELRASGIRDPETREDLALIADTARRSAELTQRLLAFGRRKSRESEVFDLRTLVDGTVSLLRQTTDRRIEVEFFPPPELPRLYLCSNDVQQVLLNLLLNARDTLVEKLAHAPDPAWSARIRIEVRQRPAGAVEPFRLPKGNRPEGWIEIDVRDNGMGMATQVLERIFEPFYTTKEVGRGTGLGLATVWHLVTELGGRIDVSSISGEGSSFRVALPVIGPPGAGPKPEAAPIPLRAAGRPLKVLLVEDEGYISRLVAFGLRRQGHSVEVMENGLDGWNLLSRAQENYDALVVDLNMPGLTGVELARRARALSPRLPILVMSGRVSEEDRAELARHGVESILRKPFTLDEFAAALLALVAE